MFPDADYSARLDRARKLMVADGVDVMLLSVGADMPYFSGYEATPLERLTMLVVPRDGAATMVVPRLEAPRVTPRGDAFTVLPWDETEDPVAIVAKHARGATKAGLGEQTWALFLMALQKEMPKTSFISASGVTRELRMRKDPDELALLRAAAEATDRVVAALDAVSFAGRTERDVSEEVQSRVLGQGHDTAPFAIVASGPNAASPHHEASHRVIEEGDTVVVDFGGRWRRVLLRYHPDLLRRRAQRRGGRSVCGARSRTGGGACCGATGGRRPGHRSGDAARDRCRRLRRSVHPSHRTRHRSRSARASVHGGRQ